MRICGIVITYYPDVHKTISNILTYIADLEHLIIWENTPSEDISEYHIYLPSKYKNKVTFCTTGRNEGIAFPLNKAAKYAYNNGYTHLLTMDQDSIWQDFKKYHDEIEKYDDNRFAAFAPLIYDASRNVLGFNTTSQFITSGAVYSLTHYFQIGHFCEEFMIDCVDTEYSLRIRKFKFDIKLMTDCWLTQRFGDLKKVHFLNCYHANYSAFRLYHILRNNIWMWHMYRHTNLLNKSFFVYDIIYKYLIREPALILLVGKGKTKRLVALIKGLWDGLFNYRESLKSYLGD